MISVAIALLIAAPLGAGSPPLTPLSVRFFPLLQEAPIFIAVEQGDFAAQGIEVRWQDLREVSLIWPALISGQLDVQWGGASAGFFEAVRKGAKLRIVGDGGHATPEDTSNAFMVRQDLIDSRRFRTPGDLRGMRIGLPGRAGIAEWFLLAILRKRALLTTQDVQIQLVPIPLLPDAFRAKTIDAAPVVEPLVTRLETLGQGWWIRAGWIEKGLDARAVY